MSCLFLSNVGLPFGRIVLQGQDWDSANFSVQDFTIDCDTVKVTKTNGNMYERTLRGQVWLKRLQRGHIKGGCMIYFGVVENPG